MKKLFCILALAHTLLLAFCLEKENGGISSPGELKINFSDDTSFRLHDSTNFQIIFYFMDEDTMIQAASIIKQITEERNINSVNAMVQFLDNEKLNYTRQEYSNSSNYYIESPAFVEEYLVPKYGIKPGKKHTGDDITVEYTNWNRETKGYTKATYTYPETPEKNYTKEYLDYNKAFDAYNGIVFTYVDKTCEYNNWNNDNKKYDYLKYTYPNHTEEFIHYDKYNKIFERKKYTYTDRSIEWSNYNKYSHQYKDCTYTYQDHTEEYRGYRSAGKSDFERHLYVNDSTKDFIVERTLWNEATKHYKREKYTYPNNSSEDCIIERTYYNNATALYELEKWTYPNNNSKSHTREWKNWNEDTSMYEISKHTFPDKIIEYNMSKKAPPFHQYDVDIKDNNGNLVAYTHLLKVKRADSMRLKC